MRTTVLVAAFALLATAAQAQYAAIIVHLTGQAKVTSAGKETPARLLLKLAAGDRIHSMPGSDVGIVMMVGGGRFQLTGDQIGTVTGAGVTGAKSLAGLRGPSAEAARALAGSRAGVNFARPLGDAADLEYHFKGWLPSGTRRFSWRRTKDQPDLFQASRFDPATQPATYRFSLFDRSGNLLWSVVTVEPEATAPADLPLQERDEKGFPLTYIWRIDPYKRDGSVVGANGSGNPRWGMLSFLDKDQEAVMNAATGPLQKDIDSNPTDSSLRVMLAAAYTANGVPMAAIVELRKIEDQDTTAALEEVYNGVGSLAAYFAGFGVRQDRRK